MLFAINKLIEIIHLFLEIYTTYVNWTFIISAVPLKVSKIFITIDEHFSTAFWKFIFIFDE